MKRELHFGVATYLVGTALTFAIAAILWADHEPAAAAALILASPFPCPPGLPC